MNPVIHYTHDEVKDLLNANTIVARLENLELRNKDNWESFKEHIAKEDALYTKLVTKLELMDHSLVNYKDYVSECRSDLEDNTLSRYITKDQLDLALVRQTEAISASLSSRFENFANRFEKKISENEAQVAENTKAIQKFTYTLSGVLVVITILFGIVEFIGNGLSILGSVNGK